MSVNMDLFCHVFFGCPAVTAPATAAGCHVDEDGVALSDNDCGASVVLDMTSPSEPNTSFFSSPDGFNSQEVELGEDLSKYPSNQLSTPQLFDGESSFGSSRASLSGSMRVYGRSDEDEASDRHQEEPATHQDDELAATHQCVIPHSVREAPHLFGTLSLSNDQPSGTPSAKSMSLSELVALGLIPPHPRISAPAYPAHLPHVRCCYDSSRIKDCARSHNCYHLHCDGADRCRPAGLKPHEVYVPRPHVIAYNEVQSNLSAAVASLPCNYGLNCKSHQHRRCAVKHKFNATALAEYEAYVRAFRSYEFAVIQYYLSANQVRRQLTDEDVREAVAQRRDAPSSRGGLW